MTSLLYPKPEPLQRTRRRKVRLDTDMKRLVRAEVFARDGEQCAVTSRLAVEDSLLLQQWFGVCAGPLELAHLFGHRRSGTMKQEAGERHRSDRALALCRHHHSCEEHKGLRFVGMDPELGMSSPLIGWWVAPKKVVGP